VTASAGGRNEGKQPSSGGNNGISKEELLRRVKEANQQSQTNAALRK
jgi:hypothetical protein